jgi:dienelactone hydrolase
MLRNILMSLLLLASVSAQAAVVGEEVSYQSGDTTLKGYLARDTAIQGKRPGILVVHEWWGLNEYARERARQLAELGYVALAVDMYGDGKTADHPDDAGKFASAVRSNLPLMQARFEAARAFLNSQPDVDPQQNAAIGYCFGGGVVLAMARSGADLDAVVSFHGSLGGGGAVAPGSVKARILVANGADDPFTTAEQIAAFKAEMDAAGADYTFINYPGARHSFTNPDADALGKKFGLPLAYNAAADADSWAEMQAFFRSVFGEVPASGQGN